MFSVGSGGEVTTSGGHPEAKPHVTHALDPKFKRDHIPNVYALCRDGMIVQYLILEVVQLAVW